VCEREKDEMRRGVGSGKGLGGVENALAAVDLSSSTSISGKRERARERARPRNHEKCVFLCANVSV